MNEEYPSVFNQGTSIKVETGQEVSPTPEPTYSNEDFDINRLPQVSPFEFLSDEEQQLQLEKTQAEEVSNLPKYNNIHEAIAGAYDATLPFTYSTQYPVESLEVDTKFQEEYLTNVYPKLEPWEQEALDGYGVRNPQQVEAILKRQRAEIETQQKLSEYGGFTGSLSLQMYTSLVNPIDWGIGIATLGSGKALTSLKTVQKVMNNYRKTSAIGLAATEGAIGNYASESTRQFTSGINMEDDRFNAFLFGAVLGAPFGASSWFQYLNSLAPQQQQSLVNAMEADTQMFNDAMDEVNASIHNRSIGSGGYSGVQHETPGPKITAASKWFSPRAWLYSVKLPSIYNFMSKMAPSNDAIVDANGNYVVQNKTTAWDIKNTTYQGKKNILVNNLMGIYNDFNADLKAKGEKPLTEVEFNQEMYKARLEYTIQRREFQAEIDYLKQQKKLNEKARKSNEQITKYNLENPDKPKELINVPTFSTVMAGRLKELENTNFQPTFKNDYHKRLNEEFDTYYGFMEDELRRPKIEKRIAELEAKLEELEVDTPAKQKEWDKIQEELDELYGWEPTEHKSYLTRVFDKDKIVSEAEVVRILTTALQNSPTARAMAKYVSPKEYNAYMEEMVKVANNMANKIQDAKNLNQLRDLLGGEGASGKNIVSGGFATGRRIDVDERLLGDLIQRDMGEILDFYHTDMAGKLAIRKAFKDDEIDTFADFKDKYFPTLTEEFRVAKMSPSEIDRTLAALEIVFDDLRGTRGIMSRPNSWGQTLKKIFTSFNNIKFGPNFPLVALNEIGPMQHMGGVKSLSYFKVAVKEAVNKIQNKQVALEMVNELQGWGIGGDIQNSKAMLRYVEGSHHFESNKVVNALRKAEHAVFRYGGLIGMTDAMKTMLAGGFTARVINIANRAASGGVVTKTERAMLSRIGLEDDMLLQIADNIKRHATYDGGIIKAFNIDDWDEGVAEYWGRTLHRVTRGNILEPTAMDIPALMSDPDKPLNGILFQYYRFPLAAQSQLLSKALNDQDVGALGAAMVSSMTTVLVEYTKVMVVAKLAEMAGIKYDNPYDDIYNDNEQQLLLAGKSFSMNPYLGMIPTAYNVAAPIGGLPLLGTEYTPKSVLGSIGGATAGNLDIIYRGLQDPDKLPYAIYQQVPHFPFLYDLGKSYIKEEF